jgi:hypothetical protein
MVHAVAAGVACSLTMGAVTVAGTHALGPSTSATLVIGLLGAVTCVVMLRLSKGRFLAAELRGALLQRAPASRVMALVCAWLGIGGRR